MTKWLCKKLPESGMWCVIKIVKVGGGWFRLGEEYYLFDYFDEFLEAFNAERY